jgi:hypothetical protein
MRHALFDGKDILSGTQVRGASNNAWRITE